MTSWFLPQADGAEFLTMYAGTILGSSVVMLGESVVTLALPSIAARSGFHFRACSGSSMATICRSPL